MLGTGVFMLSYIISLGTISVDFIIYHFYTYVVAGILGLSEHLTKGLPVGTDFLQVVQPVRNIVSILSGEQAAPIVSEFWVAISYDHAKQSNVKTFFGDIYIYAGWLKGMLVIMFCGLLSYSMMIIAILQKNLTCLVFYLFILVSMLLGWFAFFFNGLFYYEVVAYGIAIIAVAKARVYLFGPPEKKRSTQNSYGK